MKKIVFGLLVIVLSIFFVYLLLPEPSQIPPLPDSLKSTEPGDTTQIPGVSAYYSDHKRAFATKYYQEQFSKISLLGIKLPSFRLNHPPEFAHEKIRDEMLSSYFEEVVHPFRGSLFINGWEPYVFFADNKSALSKHVLIVDEDEYFSKVTLRPFYSPFWARLLNLGGILLSFIVLYFLTKKIILGE